MSVNAEDLFHKPLPMWVTEWVDWMKERTHTHTHMTRKMQTMRTRFCARKIIITWICVSLLVELLNGKSLAFYVSGLESFATFSCEVSSQFYGIQMKPCIWWFAMYQKCVCIKICALYTNVHVSVWALPWISIIKAVVCVTGRPVILSIACALIFNPKLYRQSVCVCARWLLAKSCIAMANHSFFASEILVFCVCECANLLRL